MHDRLLQGARTITKWKSVLLFNSAQRQFSALGIIAGMSITLRPLHDRVLIKRVEEKETVKGGIIIPDTAKEKSQEGEVIAAGTGKRLENGTVVPLEVKTGDCILFGKYSGAEIKLE